MAGCGRSRGVTVPRIWQWLILAVAGCVVWRLSSAWREKQELRRVLRSPTNSVEVTQAVEALVGEGSHAVPVLLQAVSNPNLRVRRAAVLGLARIGPDAGEALPAIRALLEDDDPQVRANAVVAVCNIHPRPVELASPIAQMLGDREMVVRNSVSASLKDMGLGAAPPVIAQLKSEVRETRHAAVATLVDLERDLNEPAITSALHGLWTDADADIRFEAARGFLRRQTPSIMQVRELLRDPTADVEGLALWEIVRLGPSAGALLSDLLKLLDQDRKPPRHQTGGQYPPGHFQHGSVLRAIGALQEAARPAIPELLKRFDASPGPGQMAFARCLVDVGVDRSQMVGRLVPLLRDTASSFEAGRLLVRMSPDEAREQVTILMPQLDREPATANEAARKAIYGMAPAAGEAVLALLKLLREPNASRGGQDALISAIGEIGPKATPAVPELLRFLADRLAHGESCDSILGALRGIGPRAADAIPDLLELAGGTAPDLTAYAPDEGLRLREGAIRALGDVGIDNPDVSDMLQALLEDEQQTLREATIDALGRCGSAAAIRRLLSSLHDGVGYVRARAALAIGALSGDRPVAVAPLIAALHDRDEYVRTAACVALGKIGPAATAAIPALQDVIDNNRNAGANGDRAPRDQVNFERQSRIPEFDRLSAADAARTALERIKLPPAD